MVMTVQDVRAKKDWLTEQVNSALKQKFNIESLRIGCGITHNADGDPDFSVRVRDMTVPESDVTPEAADFVKQTIQDLVPGSKPVLDFPGSTNAAALKLGLA